MQVSFEEKHNQDKNSTVCSKERSMSPNTLKQSILSSVWNSSTYHHIPLLSLQCSIGRLSLMERKLVLHYWSALRPLLSVSLQDTQIADQTQINSDRVREKGANTDRHIRCNWIAHKSTLPCTHTCTQLCTDVSQISKECIQRDISCSDTQ